MTLSEVVGSAVILGVSSQVSLQGWSRVSHAVATTDDFEHKHLLVEQRLLFTPAGLGHCAREGADAS